MIRVARTAIPDSLRWEKVESEYRRASEYFLGTSSSPQTRFEFNQEVWVQADVHGTLLEMFAGKCAFCESPVVPNAYRNIHHFRPRANARDPFRDRVDPDHYWWLAYDWQNLYLTCELCARHKGDQFPVAGPERASPPAGGVDLEAERPLLIDPCRDDPAAHLYFTGDGRVMNLNVSEPAFIRGEATILVFGLNRDDLVSARAQVATRVKPDIAALLRGRIERGQAAALLDESLPYWALRRTLILVEAQRYGPGGLEDVKAALAWVGGDAAWLQPYFEASTSSTPPPAAPWRRTRAPRVPKVLKHNFVTEVTLTNFRSIGELTLTLDRAAKAQEQVQAGVEPTAPASASSADEREWTVLLGENGAGKSSVLQAICLALAGEKEAGRFFEHTGILRRAYGGEPQPEEGSVTVKLTGETIHLTFDRTGFEFKSGREGAGTFLRAYGSTRLLPRPNARPTPERRPVRIDNLFDPFTPLHHADRWIARLWKEVEDTGERAAQAEGELGVAGHSGNARKIAAARRRYHRLQERHNEAVKRFNAVGRALKDLLRLEDESYVTCNADGTVVLKRGEFELPIRQLSDGYQTVIALAVDIMAGVPTREAEFKNTPGIVLLDELGTHLHPRWRMEIVGSLRRAFSGMQFIATTHEPLCLRGLRQGEIVVMRSGEDGVTAITDLPSPEKLRVDQLLTSPFFGLYTTIDPEVDGKFQLYYDLLAAQKPGEPEPEQLRTLRDELREYSFLGYTRRDQLVLDVIDRFLAQKRKEKSPVAELPQTVRDEVLRIWNNVGRITGVEV